MQQLGFFGSLDYAAPHALVFFVGADHLWQRNMPQNGRDAVVELHMGHFHAEHRHGPLLRHVEADSHAQRGFAHGWARADDYQIAGAQSTVEQAIQIGQPSCPALDAAFASGFQHVQMADHPCVSAYPLILRGCCHQPGKLCLRCFQTFVNASAGVVRKVMDGHAGSGQFAAFGALYHDASVCPHVAGRWGKLRNLADHCQIHAALQPFVHAHHIAGFALPNLAARLGVDQAHGFVCEMLWKQRFGNDVDVVVALQQTADDGLLGFGAEHAAHCWHRLVHAAALSSSWL